MTNDFKVIVLSSEHKITLQNDLLLLKKILTNYKLEFIIYNMFASDETMEQEVLVIL